MTFTLITGHIFSLKHRGGKVTTLINKVDDRIVIVNDKEEVEKFKKYLAIGFEMKDLGGLKYFLVIEVSRSANGIFLSQRECIISLLTETWMLDCNLEDTPIVQNHHLGECLNQVSTNKG